MGAIFIIMLFPFIWMFLVMPLLLERFEKMTDTVTGLIMMTSIFGICLV